MLEHQSCWFSLFHHLHLPVSEHQGHSPDWTQASGGLVGRVARSVWRTDPRVSVKEPPQDGSHAWPPARRACSVINGLESAPAGLSMEEVREYERTMQEETNCKVKSSQNAGEAAKNFKNATTKKKANIVNNARNPEKSEYLVLPPPHPSHRHPHFKIRHPSPQRR